jgi:hypothetical protein
MPCGLSLSKRASVPFDGLRAHFTQEGQNSDQCGVLGSDGGAWRSKFRPVRTSWGSDDGLAKIIRMG